MNPYSPCLLPKVTFDTSAHNRLVDDSALAEPVLACIASKRFFRFAGLSIEEMVSCKDSNKRRTALFTSCRQLHDGPSDCLNTPNVLLTRLILEHHKSPSTFDWLKVDVLTSENDSIISSCGRVVNDDLSAEQWKHQKEMIKQYKQGFSDLRPKQDEVFANNNEVPPQTFREAVERHPDWIISLRKGFYNRVANTIASEEQIQKFWDNCPPFRAVIYAISMSRYDLTARNRHVGEKFRAGRNDLFMSIYLPYCDQFVTDEKEGEQGKCLREIAALAGLATEVLSFENFSNSLLAATDATT